MKEIKISLFIANFNFEILEFEKHLIDEKKISIQEENPALALFPDSIVSVSHTAIFYVGVELVGKKVLGMRVV